MTLHSRSSQPLGWALVCAIFLSLLLSGLAASPALSNSPVASSAPRKGSADKAFAGYKIRATGKASGAWIGGRRLGGSIWYRIDPAVKAGARRYGPAKSATRVHGSRRNTARVAWIISKYGSYRDKQQSAAVDAAVYHLLVGKTFRLYGKKGARRLDQTGHLRSVRGLASYMVRESARYAGPYRLRIAVARADVGGTAVVTVRLRGRSRSTPQLPVTVTYDGQGSATAVTNARGVATLQVPARQAGPHPVRVRVGKVPATALRLRTPRGRGTRLVRATKSPRAGLARGVVRAVPRLGVRTSPTSTNKGQGVGGFIGVGSSYGTAPRAGSAQLTGPYTSAAQARSCGGRVVRRTPITVRGDGAVSLPRVTQGPGIYAWRISVAADEFNAPGSVCGGTFTVYLVPKVTASATTPAYGPSATPRAKLNVSAVSTKYRETAHVQLYGPFPSRSAAAASSSCRGNKLVSNRPVTIPSSGSFYGQKSKVAGRGWYSWRATLPYGTWTRSAVSACGSSPSIFEVR